MDLNMLIEITCSRSSSQLQSIKQSYRSRYKSDIEQDVSTRIKGGFKEVILPLSILFLKNNSVIVANLK